MIRTLAPVLAASLCLAGCYTVKYDDYAEFERKEYAQLAQFEGWLGAKGVLGAVPTEGLVRSATDWRQCKGQPWGVPPSAYWPSILPTLNLVKYHIVPLVGPVEVQSGWRSPALNACVGGSSGSKHMSYQALDLTPLTPIERNDLLDRLCTFWADHGEEWNMGLGTYDGVRFHVDAAGWRTWGPDYSAKTSACVMREASEPFSSADPLDTNDPPPTD